MATDKFSRHEARLESPAGNAETIDPGIEENLSQTSRGLYIGTDGDLHCIMEGGQEVTFIGVFGGTILPVRIVKIFSDSTASGLLNLY